MCQYLFEILFSIILDICLKVALLDCMVILVSIFRGSPVLSSLVPVPFHTLLSVREVSNFSTLLSALGFVVVFNLIGWLARLDCGHPNVLR